MRPPLVICEVPFRSLPVAERSKREKPCRLSNDSIAKSDLLAMSTLMKRDTTLATGVQQTLGFTPIKIVLRL